MSEDERLKREVKKLVLDEPPQQYPDWPPTNRSVDVHACTEDDMEGFGERPLEDPPIHPVDRQEIIEALKHASICRGAGSPDNCASCAHVEEVLERLRGDGRGGIATDPEIDEWLSRTCGNGPKEIFIARLINRIRLPERITQCESCGAPKKFVQVCINRRCGR